MDLRNSPYVPGAGTRPVALAGRGDILERFDVTLSRLEAGRADTAPLIMGARGSGKTVLLNEFGAMAKKRGWFVASEEVIPNTPLSSLIAVLAHEVLLEMSTRHRVAANVRRALGVLKAFTAVSALGVSLSIDVDAVRGTADTGLFSRDLRRLFTEIGEVAKEQSVGVVFSLDEIHTLESDELSDLNSAMHRTAQIGLPVVFIGAGLFPSWQQAGRIKQSPLRLSSYVARMETSFVRLKPLDSAASREAFTAPALSEGVDFSDAALDEAVQFCQGNSWLIQLMGAEVWEVSSGPTIALFDVQVASDRVRQKLNQWFFPRLTRGCTDKELEILALIANGSHHGIMNFDSVSDCANSLQLDGAWAVRYALTELAKRDLIELEYTDGPIYDNDGFGVRLSVPMMDDYFRTTGGIFGFSAVHHTNNEKSEPYSRPSELPGKSNVPRELVTPRPGAGRDGEGQLPAWRGRPGRTKEEPAAMRLRHRRRLPQR